MIRHAFLGLILATTSAPLLAEIMEIHSVTPTFVKFTDGRVGFLDELPKKDLLFTHRMDVVLDDEANIKSLKPLAGSPLRDEALESPLDAEPPTVMPTYASAQALLNTFPNNDLRDAQCYDRAHTWSWLAYTRNRVKLQKAFLFFSDNYIARYRYKWWFHVAPFTTLILKGERVERVMDRKFVSAPLKFKLWTDIFMINKVECRVVPLYTDYSEHPGEDDCYIIKSSIYYWQPKDLEQYAKTGREKTQFIDWEVRYALEHAYGMIISQ